MAIVGGAGQSLRCWARFLTGGRISPSRHRPPPTSSHIPVRLFQDHKRKFYPIEDLSVEVSLRCAKIGRGTDTSPMNKCEPSMHTSKQRWTKHTLDGPRVYMKLAPAKCCWLTSGRAVVRPTRCSRVIPAVEDSVALRQTVSLRDETAFGWRHSMGSHPERLGAAHQGPGNARLQAPRNTTACSTPQTPAPPRPRLTPIHAKAVGGQAASARPQSRPCGGRGES